MSNNKSQIKKLSAFIIVVLLIGGGVYYYNQSSSNVNTDAKNKTMSNSPTGNETMKQNIDLSTDENGLSKAVATLSTDKGEIKFKFYTKDAPDTVNRIVELIQSGFYNGIVFHRVEGWVVQTGDPTGTGTGGSGQNIKAEFNNRKHQAGSVGMARTADPDSADSQFYFVFGPQPHLDHNYTVFAQVIEGLDVLKTISRGDKMNSLSVK